MSPIPLLPDRYYHIYNHGNGSDLLFREPANYAYFLKKYAQYCAPVADTFAYCLMANHFHFFVRIKPDAELAIHFEISDKLRPVEWQAQLARQLSQKFSNFFNAYAKAYNNHFGHKGALFLNPFKRKEVIDERYYNQLIYYIHHNPVKHGFSSEISRWPYSSFQSLLSDKSTLLCRDDVLNWFGGRDAFIAFHANTD
ncbi:hypothetical protein EHT87_27440 [Larkinella knui]|uniref:Transposase IS200-like domain-containing protein n=2 Tax=Larkinella knui TaxID=2025310 RepID=A0A3P1CCT1_9BACT|nr:hypothetical protein EHT87_27440 [Larkinella knui]